MAKPDLLDAFRAMNFEEQAAFIKEANGIHEDGKAAKRAELMAQLQAPGGPPATVKAPRASGGNRQSPAPKYRSMKNPDVTWSGRGALARFLKEEMQETGRPIEDFLIKQ